MFRCQLSGELSLPGEKPVKVITKTRPVEYKFFDRSGKLINKTQGWEIVEEMVVCQKVAKKLGYQNGQRIG